MCLFYAAAFYFIQQLYSAHDAQEASGCRGRVHRAGWQRRRRRRAAAAAQITAAAPGMGRCPRALLVTVCLLCTANVTISRLQAAPLSPLQPDGAVEFTLVAVQRMIKHGEHEQQRSWRAVASWKRLPDEDPRAARTVVCPVVVHAHMQ